MDLSLKDDKVYLVFCTTSTRSEALDIARALISKKLAACVNVIDEVYSIYEWEGEIEETKEHILVIKTVASLFDRLKMEIKALHSYELPEIIAIEIKDGSNRYLEWIKNSCKL